MIFTKKKNCEEQNAIKFQAWQKKNLNKMSASLLKKIKQLTKLYLSTESKFTSKCSPREPCPINTYNNVKTINFTIIIVITTSHSVSKKMNKVYFRWWPA